MKYVIIPATCCQDWSTVIDGNIYGTLEKSSFLLVVDFFVQLKYMSIKIKHRGWGNETGIDSLAYLLGTEGIYIYIYIYYCIDMLYI